MAKLFEELMNLPLEESDFNNIKLELDDDDSFGSCCSSPLHSGSDCASPTQSSDNGCCVSPENDYDENDFFTFSLLNSENKFTPKKKQTKLENKIKRNERERRRVRRLAEGFRKLRGVVPGEAKKLSKLQTLQTALQYMAHLSDMVSHEMQENGNTYQPQVYTPTVSPTFHQPPTQTLSHPPINWPINSMNPNEQQMYQPINEQCLFSPTQQQQMHAPVWFYN